VRYAILALVLLAGCATTPPNADPCDHRCWEMLEHCAEDDVPRACEHEREACAEECRR